MGDINKGRTWISGEQVTHAKLNDFLDSATIADSIITGKSAASSLSGTAKTLVHDGSGLKQATLDVAVFNNDGLLVGRSALLGAGSVSTADSILLSDASDSGLLKKATLQSAVFESNELIANRTAKTTPDIDDEVLVRESGGAFKRVTRENLLAYQWENTILLSGLTTALTAPVGDDYLPIWDASAAANRKLTLDNLVTGLTLEATPVLADEVMFYDVSATAPKLRKTTLDNIKTAILPGIYSKAAIADFAVPDYNTATAKAHGLAGRPQMVRATLVCTTAVNGYSIGDEIDLCEVEGNGGMAIAFQVVVDATNITLLYASGGANLYIIPKGGGALTDIYSARGNWNLRLHAIYFP